ncbi:MAG: helix-turn-helix domain-containing protein [Chlorobia bacterium]|nr:helix-turn-helix domain-containing protein [Fimbriimonadaceae bacterium]
MRTADQDNDPIVASVFADHWIERPGYWTSRHKGATSWLVILTLGGVGRFVHREGNFDTKRGDVVLMRPKRLHEYGIAPGQTEWDFLWVHFHIRQHWLNLLQWTIEGPGMMRERLSEAELGDVVKALQDSMEAKKAPGRHSDAMALNHLERALILIASRSALSQTPKLDSRIRTAIGHMRRDLTQLMSIGDLARAAGLSESRFAHLFSQETGVSPRKYLEQLRLERSKQLLELTDLTIREIAHSLGYASEFYFSQRFQAEFAERPSVFRIRVRGRQESP